MIKVIIFDVGGVLYKRSYYGYYRHSFDYFSKKLGVETDKIKNAFVSSDKNILEGRESADEFIKKVSKKIGKQIKTEDFLKIAKNSSKNLDPKMLSLARELKNRYGVVVLSDNIHEATVPMKKKISKYFDKTYFSDELGMKKPSLKIFRHVCKDLGVKPSECIFIDDKVKNTDAAKKLGMHIINFNVYDMDVKYLAKKIGSILALSKK